MISEIAFLYSRPLEVKLRNVSSAFVFRRSMAASIRLMAVSMKSKVSMDSSFADEPEFPDLPEPEPPVPPDFA